MSDHGRKPKRWAIDLNTILMALASEHRFPIGVKELAKDFSAQRFPNSPIVEVKGGSLGAFEGALYPVHDGRGWAIIYNNDVTDGRSRFTIAHEFGHYLMHRALFPKGIKCSEDAVTFRDGTGLEQEADTFAAYLLMPFDDFRKQFDADAIPSLDDFNALRKRYGVSLISCVLRWLEYTNRRSMVVLSRDGFILWSKSSDPAFKTRLFIRTRGVPPVSVPVGSLIERREFGDSSRLGVSHPSGIWFREECTEITVHSDRYDQSLTILHFSKDSPRVFFADEPDEVDAFARFIPAIRERFD